MLPENYLLLNITAETDTAMEYIHFGPIQLCVNNNTKTLCERQNANLQFNRDSYNTTLTTPRCSITV